MDRQEVPGDIILAFATSQGWTVKQTLNGLCASVQWMSMKYNIPMDVITKEMLRMDTYFIEERREIYANNEG